MLGYSVRGEGYLSLITLMATDKQVRANRENAKKGGPKTQHGKEIVRRNALQHGILSAAMFIDKGEGKEDAAELEALQKRLIEELAPIGIIEEMLTDRILSSYWRLRRVLWAETGEVRKDQDSVMLLRIMRRVEKERSYSKVPDVFYESRLRNSFGIKALLELLDEAKTELQSENFLSDDTEERLIKNFGDVSAPMTISLAALAFNRIAKGEPDDTLTPEQATGATMTMLETEEQRLRELLDMIQEKESLEDDAHLLATSLPAGEILEKIVRYESALERSIFRSLHELQRLQALRLGKTVPPPIAIDVDIENRG